jgi:hypothetical protein
MLRRRSRLRERCGAYSCSGMKLQAGSEYRRPGMAMMTAPKLFVAVSKLWWGWSGVGEEARWQFVRGTEWNGGH